MKSISCLAIGLIVSITLAAQKQNFNAWTVNSIKFDYDSLFHANDWRKEYKGALSARIGENWMEKMLRPGYNMPDILIGNEINNPHEDIWLSRFSGKLVIFDFWNTWCPSCIASFPEMEALQKKFGDSIQILLINLWETKDHIEKRRIKLPNLPVIINAKNLFPFFPHQIQPYHVWIDALRKVKLMGYDFNTYESKIRDALYGRDINFIQTEGTVPGYNMEMCYYMLLGIQIDKNKYNAYFTAFNPNYAPSGGLSRWIVDSVQRIRRTTYVNFSLLTILSFAWENHLFPSEENIIYSPHIFKVELRVRDTLRYTDHFLNLSERTDKTYSKSRCCYEQIAPLYYKPDQLEELMRGDLGNFVTKELGAEVRLQQDSSLVNVLVKINNPKDLSSLHQVIAKSKTDTFLIGGQKMVRYKDCSVQDAIKWNTNYNGFKEFKNEYVISKLNPEILKYLFLPLQPDFTLVRKALRMQGYDFVKKYKKITRLIIQDIQK